MRPATGISAQWVQAANHTAQNLHILLSNCQTRRAGCHVWTSSCSQWFRNSANVGSTPPEINYAYKYMIHKRPKGHSMPSSQANSISNMTTISYTGNGNGNFFQRYSCVVDLLIFLLKWFSRFVIFHNMAYKETPTIMHSIYSVH